jgi:hypothetical protein
VLLVLRQFAVMAVYSAVSTLHPSAVPALHYHLLVEIARNDDNGEQPLSLQLVPQALLMLSRHVKLHGEDHAGNVVMAFKILSRTSESGGRAVEYGRAFHVFMHILQILNVYFFLAVMLHSTIDATQSCTANPYVTCVLVHN